MASAPALPAQPAQDASEVKRTGSVVMRLLRPQYNAEVRPEPAGFACLVLAVLLTGACGGGAAEENEPGVLIGVLPTRAADGYSPTPTVAGEAVTAEPTPPPRSPMVVSLAWLDGAPPVPELPSAFAPRAEDGGLKAAIELVLAGREGSYSVVVHNVANGRSAAINDGQVYYAASLFKLELLLETYRQREAGELDFAELLTVDKKYVEYDLKTLEALGILEGDQVSLHDAVRAMAIASDTPTAVLMQDRLNAARVDETLGSLGLTDTENANRDLPTTARDMARLLTAIAAGEGGVSEASRTEMLSLLQQEWFDDGVPAGVPEGALVAHKTGSYTDATHDVALVWGPTGPYVIAVLTDRSHDWTAIREVSRAVWEYFAANP
jgi:beta-lactamase class A